MQIDFYKNCEVVESDVIINFYQYTRLSELNGREQAYKRAPDTRYEKYVSLHASSVKRF